MSLINDALKRAKEAQPATTPTPEPRQPMQPAEPPAEPPKSKTLPPYFLPAVLIVLCGACWFLIQGWEAKRQAGIYPEPVTVQAREASAAPAVGGTAPAESMTAASTAAKSTNPAGPAGSNSVVAATESAATEPVPEPAARSQLTFKLQGIFYRPANPAAVVNAKTVFIGDTVNEAKVTSIDRQSVTLVYDGQTKVLTLH
jgi:hypothetical protein